MATDRDAVAHAGDFVRGVHGFVGIGRHVAFLGFTGNRYWWLRDRTKRGNAYCQFIVKETEIGGVMEIIEDLLFGDNVKYLQCSKCSAKLTGVDTIVIHATGGASAISSALYLCRPDTSVSAHAVIARDGEVFQLLPFCLKAWHAGRGFHAGRVFLNDCSIGIELDNAGELKRVAIVTSRGSGGNIHPIRSTRRRRTGKRSTGICLPRGSLPSWRRCAGC